MNQPKVKKPVIWIVLSVMILSGGKVVLGQGPPQGKPLARASQLREVLDTIENVAKERPRIFRTNDAYVRFLMAPPSTHFAVDRAYRGTPQAAADWFLNRWRNLFVNESPAVEFEVIRVNTTGSRSYVGYRQKFAGIEVYGAQINFQVNASGGIVAAMSDIMRDTESIEKGRISIDPNLTSQEAQNKGVEYLSEEHQNIEFEESQTSFMIFDPKVVGWEGEPKPVWHTVISAVDEIPVGKGLLIDARNGQIAFSYGLTDYAIKRKIYDYNNTSDTGTLKIWDGHPPYNYPSDVQDANQVYLDLAEVYDFYEENHSWLSYDGSDSEIEAYVRYCHPVFAPTCPGNWEDAVWDGTYERMYIGDGYVLLDVVAHEFTHGVTDNTSGLGGGATESHAIKESLSDMWGAWIEGDWDIGEDDPNENNRPWRDMSSPHDSKWYSGPQYYEEPNYWTNDPNEYIYSHTNCGVGNYLCYMLTDGDTFRGYTVTGMDVDDAAALFWECQSNLLGPGSDYHDLGNYLLLAADSLGFTSAERYNVEKACRAVKIYTPIPVFYVGSVAWFDDIGDLVLTGTLTQGTAPTATGNDEFRIKDSGGDDVAIIDLTDGDMVIEGSKYEEQTSMSGASNFIVKDDYGNVVAYINTSGDLYLTGKVHENQ